MENKKENKNSAVLCVEYKLWKDPPYCFQVLRREKERQCVWGRAREREREREMRQEVTQKDDKNKEDDDLEACRSGEVEVVSSGSRYLSLLTSKERDFLLSPTGTQVLSLSLSLSDIL